jgi:hypothetical protein
MESAGARKGGLGLIFMVSFQLLKGGMLVDTKLAEADMAQLQKEADHLRMQRAAIDRRLAEIEATRTKVAIFLDMAAAYAAGRAVTSAASVQADLLAEHSPEYVTARSPSARQPYGHWPKVVEASIDILRKLGKPLHTRQLFTELQKRGFTFTVKDPLINLSNKLGKSPLLRSYGTLGWHLVEWPEPTQTTRSTEDRLKVLRALNDVFPDLGDQKESQTDTQTQDQAFFGKGLPEAATELLIKQAKPMGNAEIAVALAEAGFPFTQKDHATAVEGALKRRLSSDGDVARVAPGTWGLVQWFTDEQLREFAQNLGGMPGRDAQAHLDATRAAVQVARARGVKFGRRPTFDDDQMARVRQLINEGTSPKEIAHSLGVRPALVLRWIKKWAQEKERMSLANP